MTNISPPHWGAIHTERGGKVELSPQQYSEALDKAFSAGVRAAADHAEPAAPAFPAEFPFYELKFIMRVLSHEGSAPREDWQTARGMANSIYEQWHAHARGAGPNPSSGAGVLK